MSNQVHPSYTIGFFTTGVELEYSYILFKSVAKVAQEYHVNLINFLGGSLNPDFSFQQYKYQYQCNVAFNYATEDVLDGIILASGVLSSFLSSSEYSHFYSKYAPIPMVSLGATAKGIPSVYTDNKAVLKELVSHLITAHHKENIAFISGPSSNCDALERYKGYKEALLENHLPFREEYIQIGDFTPDSAIEAVKVLFDKKKLPIDAIVCANDSMALTVLNELQKRGIKVPEEVVLTGFDNIHSSSYCVPSLSTIEQPLEDFARCAFNLLFDCIQGKVVQNKLVPCKIIIRESCGCDFSSTVPVKGLIATHKEAALLTDCFLAHCLYFLPDHTAYRLKDFVFKMYSLLFLPTAQSDFQKELTTDFLAYKNELSPSLHTTLNLKHFLAALKKDLLLRCPDLKIATIISDLFETLTEQLFNDALKYYGHKTDKLTNNFAFIRQVLLTITLNIHDKRLQLASITKSLIACGIPTCLIYLYDQGITHNLTDDWKMPSHLSLYMGYIDEEIIDTSDILPTVTPNEVVTYGLTKRDRNYISFIHPIFFGNEQLGMIVLELPPDNYNLIETLTVELGCALKLSSIFMTQKNTETKLETLSQTDELTGLLNRRGFFSKALSSYSDSKFENRHGVLFYADMDGLKLINDTCGHNEGDVAIKAMSTIFKKVFQSPDDIIARMGGDEFTMLCLGRDAEYIEEIQKQVHTLCEEYNEQHDKTYHFSISIGGVTFSPHSRLTLEELLSAADKKLYRIKKSKKQHR